MDVRAVNPDYAGVEKGRRSGALLVYSLLPFFFFCVHFDSYSCGLRSAVRGFGSYERTHLSSVLLDCPGSVYETIY